MATHGAPKWPRAAQSDPNGNQSRPKERKRTSEDTPRRATNHKTIYTYTEYTQTPDPPPYSGRLVMMVLIIVTVVILVIMVTITITPNDNT